MGARRVVVSCPQAAQDESQGTDLTWVTSLEDLQEDEKERDLEQSLVPLRKAELEELADQWMTRLGEAATLVAEAAMPP